MSVLLHHGRTTPCFFSVNCCWPVADAVVAFVEGALHIPDTMSPFSAGKYRKIKILLVCAPGHNFTA